jgi:FtsP/CotA-like multicopper oxidase with cupredoxin domain
MIRRDKVRNRHAPVEALHRPTWTDLPLVHSRVSVSKLAFGSVVVVAAAALAPAVAHAYGGTGTTCANSGCTTAFAVPMPVPATLQPTSSDATTDYYTVTEKVANIPAIPGKTTPMWTYNGTWPGPVIKAKSGRQVKLTVVNNLPIPTTLHNHGAHVDPSSDGGPTDTVAPGASRVYTYPNGISARTDWFHDHVKDLTGRNVYMGLAGMYEIGDSQEAAMNLPSGAYDVPLIFQDRKFNTDGTLAYSTTSNDWRDGTLGDTMFVNGAATPYFKVEARKYRFRLLNGSNGRYYNLSLSNSQAMVQVANEAGFLSVPYSMSSIPLTPAERADIIVDFSKVAVGTSVTLNNGSGWNSTGGGLMRFDVGARTSTDTSNVPVSFRPFTPLPAAAVTVRRTFSIKQTNGMWMFNDKGYDPNRVDAAVKLGATEEWTFENRSGQDHPIHLHDINFHVVSGGATSGPDAQWKETINLPSWRTLTVRVQFPDFTGKYVFHCHILEHEDNMLMGQFQVS